MKVAQTKAPGPDPGEDGVTITSRDAEPTQRCNEVSRHRVRSHAVGRGKARCCAVGKCCKAVPSARTIKDVRAVLRSVATRVH